MASSRLLGRVTLNDKLTDINLIPTDSRVSISNGDLTTRVHIRSDGTFVFQDLKPGRYILRVQCRRFSFPMLKVRLSDDDQGSIPIVSPYSISQAEPDPRANHFEHKLQHPIQISPISILEYYEIPVGFNPLSILLGNPMYLLMGGMVIFMILMPKLLNLLDPDALAELQENQSNMHKQMSLIQNMDLTSGISNILSQQSEEDEKRTSTQGRISSDKQKDASIKRRR
ncbi:hypothetical protein BY996DRAFT_6433286 [Phakopsora pachyrhizi]|uniref:ER membrane protein complex subunit 7 beta-sandwich domain-containing protein n=1 Tax=Phakopsora pachyrhizi TaxID=170000 RepID=A0AAV0B5Y3_PHAPC|nr:hypothetical protein BY996DRAFT_6433286 [Phakopsora pachyrhizi]CAH7681062.1 hypothetical protein PPACK8108_LOCUS13607 [Phakopsora pachyrhizi]